MRTIEFGYGDAVWSVPGLRAKLCYAVDPDNPHTVPWRPPPCLFREIQGAPDYRRGGLPIPTAADGRIRTWRGMSCPEWFVRPRRTIGPLSHVAVVAPWPDRRVAQALYRFDLSFPVDRNVAADMLAESGDMCAWEAPVRAGLVANCGQVLLAFALPGDGLTVLTEGAVLSLPPCPHYRPRAAPRAGPVPLLVSAPLTPAPSGR